MVNNETTVFWCLIGALWSLVYVIATGRMVKKADPTWNAIELSSLPFAVIGSVAGLAVVTVFVAFFWVTGLMHYWHIKFIWEFI